MPRSNAQKVQKRQINKAANRARLLAAARAEFARNGYHGTTVRDIAGTAGLSIGAFYASFPNKSDIYLEIINEISSTMRKVMDSAVEEFMDKWRKAPSKKLTVELIRSPIEKVLNVALENGEVFHILQREGMGLDTTFRKHFDRLWEESVQIASKWVQTFIDQGFSKPFETDLLARAVLGMFFTMVVYSLNSGKDRVDDIVDTIAAMIQGGAQRLATMKKK